MVKEDQIHFRARRGPAFQLAAVALVLFSLSGTGFLMARLLRGHEGEPPTGAAGPSAAAPPSRLFHDWPQNVPLDLVVLLSGEQHGYLKPCGCTNPQYGGLERRYNLMQQLAKQRGWKFAALDIGDIAQDSGPQKLRKYVLSMKALKIMDYAAVGLGLNEINMPLIEALGNYALNENKPRVLAANLDRSELPDMVADSKIVGEGNQPRIWVVSVVGESVIKKKRDPQAKFPASDKPGQGNPAVLKKLLTQPAGEKVDLRLLLYVGSAAEAKKCAQTFPQFDVIVCESDDPEPPEKPEQVGNTLVITTGHKGRNVGLLGLYRTGQGDRPFNLRYQLVPLGPEYETPNGQEKGHPILELFEEYTRKLRDDNYLAKYGKRKHLIQVDYPEATYVGSDRCKTCHKEAFKVWQNSAHSHAYKTLKEATRPSLRQYDGECILCHVTGFEHVDGFTNEKDLKLINVGCESCHGPGSVHISNENRKKTDAKLNAAMNPFKPKPAENPQQKTARLLKMADACRQCHDTDNDVHWDKDWFTKKWKPIEHYEPKD